MAKKIEQALKALPVSRCFYVCKVGNAKRQIRVFAIENRKYPPQAPAKLLARWNYRGVLDAFHMSSMILTGMGPVAEMKSDAAKIFSSFYALYSGIAFLSITAVFLTPVVHRLLHILHIEQ